MFVLVFFEQGINFIIFFRVAQALLEAIRALDTKAGDDVYGLIEVALFKCLEIMDHKFQRQLFVSINFDHRLQYPLIFVLGQWVLKFRFIYSFIFQLDESIQWEQDDDEQWKLNKRKVWDGMGIWEKKKKKKYGHSVEQAPRCQCPVNFHLCGRLMALHPKIKKLSLFPCF